MSDSLKDKAGSALFWNFVDKGGQQVIQMVFLYILARLLDVELFGIVAILSVFTVLANIIQESGFFSALVRKTNADEADYSSVFYFNITASIILYLILFCCAPYIARFFDQPILVDLSRFVFLSFIFNAFSLVQYVHLVKRLAFKTNTKITFVAGLISGIVAVAMAFSGYGVWSLAVQLVLQTFIRSVLLWLFVKWHPGSKFVFERIKLMFGYSAKLMINSISNQLTSKIYSIVIGKHFSIADVGYYDQAYKLNNIPQGTIGSSIQGVAFPVLSKIDCIERKKRVFQKIMRIASFVAFPAAMLTIVAAEPIVSILLSDKWLPIVPFIRIFAIGWAFYPPFCLIATLLQSEGKSGLLLKIELGRSFLYISAIFLAINFGVLGLVSAYTLVNVIVFVYAAYFSGKSISYRFTEVFSDIIPYIAISALVFLPLYFLSELNINRFLLLTIQIVVGCGGYLLIIKLLGSQVLADCIHFIKTKTINR